MKMLIKASTIRNWIARVCRQFTGEVVFEEETADAWQKAQQDGRILTQNTAVVLIVDRP